MRSRLFLIAVLALAVGTVSFAVVSHAHNQQPAEKQFALSMKATGPEFFKKTQEPEGLKLVEQHLKKLQALTEQGVCIFSGHALNTDGTGFGIIVVRTDSEASAQKIIDDDDLVKAGWVRGTVFPFQVVTASK